MNFNPSRLTLARKCRGLTKRSLAEQVGISERMLYAHEMGQYVPTHENIAAFSNVLNFPMAFFAGEDLDIIPVEAASFRALSKMTASKRDMSLSDGSIVVGLINTWLESHFNLPDADLPDLTEDGNMLPDTAAERLRLYWGLGSLPIKNILHLVESKGIRVFSLPEAQRDADAFSYWYNNVKPFIFLDHTKTSERCRFDIAHELGHLLLHRRETLNRNQNTQNTRRLEEEAHNFASTFLMPQRALVASAPQNITMQNLVQCKHYWKVSLLALAYRLNKVGIISDWTYRNVCVNASQYGRTHEYQGLPNEQSQIISKVLELLTKENKTMHDISNDTGLYPTQISEYFFNMAIQPKTPCLRLIK
jgi:Zn-dependent peptidase ImmA (M78 family)/DNA-binding XRE family transcriptional regulator